MDNRVTCARGFSAALSYSNKHVNLDCSPSQIYIQFGSAEGGFQHAFTCGLAMLSLFHSLLLHVVWLQRG